MLYDEDDNWRGGEKSSAVRVGTSENESEQFIRTAFKIECSFAKDKKTAGSATAAEDTNTDTDTTRRGQQINRNKANSQIAIGH
ncbi:hypothetical protein ACLKA7_010867 [Drosophila subpalustris]